MSLLNTVTPVEQILAQHRNYPIRIAAAREQLFMAKGVVEEINLDAAIKAAAVNLAQDLDFKNCLPALALAVVVESVRPELLAALEAELVGNLESEFAKFQTENEVLLRAHGATKPVLKKST